MKKITMMYIAIIIMMSNALSVANVEAASTAIKVTTLNEKNTVIENKYKITGAILKIQKEATTTLVLTMDGFYQISNGKVKKYTFSSKISTTTSFQKIGDEVYISPLLQTDSKDGASFVEAQVNLGTGTKKITTNYSDYLNKINHSWDPDEVTSFVDSFNNRWFATLKDGSKKNYSLYRINTSGEIMEFENSRDYYDDMIKAFDDLSYDLSGNIYYTYTFGTYTGRTGYVDSQGNSSKFKSVLNRVSKELKKKSFEVYGPIDDYKIGAKGDIWVLSGNKTLIHMDKNGKQLTKITLGDGKAISIDKSGNVFVLDGTKVKLVYKDKLYTKVSLSSAYRYHDLTMINKENMIAYNENTFELINGINKDIIVSDSYIKTKPYMVKDNKGNITIFSKNPSTQNNNNIKLYRIGSAGITFKDLYSNIGEYDRAFAYDDSIYIPHVDDENDITINRLTSDFKIEKYISLPIYYSTFVGMQVDSKKNLYVLTNQTLYKISPSKKIQVVDITDEKGGYANSISGFMKDKYNNLYVKYSKKDAYYNDTYGLFKVNDILDIKPIKINTANYVDILFVTHKNEIAMVKTDVKNGNKLYRMDSKGLPIRDVTYNGTSYYNPDGLDNLERIWKASDGAVFYERWDVLFKKTATKEIGVAVIDQVIDDPYGSIYYTDYSNLYIYDKQMPKITTTYPKNGQSKVSLTSNVTLQLSEPVMKRVEFKNIILSANGSKVAISYDLVDNKIVINPKYKLKSKTKFTVIIPKQAIKDLAGNTLSSNYTYTFTTQ